MLVEIRQKVILWTVHKIWNSCFWDTKFVSFPLPMKSKMLVRKIESLLFKFCLPNIWKRKYWMIHLMQESSKIRAHLSNYWSIYPIRKYQNRSRCMCHYVCRLLSWATAPDPVYLRWKAKGRAAFLTEWFCQLASATVYGCTLKNCDRSSILIRTWHSCIVRVKIRTWCVSFA